MILGFDTSERRATVGVFDGSNALATFDSEQYISKVESPEKIGSSTAIVSMIQGVLADAKISPDQLSAIAFSNGPGTFTGLRVGVVTARMLCYAWKLPAIVVNSLEVSADRLTRANNLEAGTKIWAAVNAQRKQVFAAGFEVQTDADLKPVEPMELLDQKAFLDRIQEGDHVTGNGAAMYTDSIETKTGFSLPDKNIRCCDAAGISFLAERRLLKKNFDDLWKIEPIYFRPSAAEEMRLSEELGS